MSDGDSGSFVRRVKTQSGGFRIIRKSGRGSNILEVSYFDKDGTERKDEMRWKKYSLWSRMSDKMAWLFRWFAGRL